MSHNKSKEEKKTNKGQLIVDSDNIHVFSYIRTCKFYFSLAYKEASFL